MNVWIAIAGMTVVTWLPRSLPFVLGSQVRPPAWARRWLQGFPWAALGALIFPGILDAVPGAPLVALAAGLVAALVALRVRSPVVAVVAAVAAAVLLDLAV